jgi:two-component system chemotaxis sensor kinase CheA
MPDDTNELLKKLAELNSKLGIELVFAEPGKDNGLLPINFIVNQMDELCAATPPPPEVARAMGVIHQWLDRIFSGSGFFDVASIKSVGSWTQWMERFLECTLNRQTPPAWPADWDGGGEPKSSASPEAAGASASPASDKGAEVESDPPLVVSFDDVEMLREFISESYEHLQNIELGVLVLEEKPEDHDTLNSIFRAFHTFKGGSGVLNLTNVNHLAHELESLLDLARQKKIAISSPVIEIILEGGDLLKRFTTEIDLQLTGQKPAAPISIPTAAFIGRVKDLVRTGGTVSARSASPSEPVAAAASAALAPTSPPQAAAPISAPTPTPAPAATAEVKPVGESAAGTKGVAAPTVAPDASVLAAGSGGSLVKVATQKLDNLVDLTGEMVIAQSQVVHDPSLKDLADVRLMRNLTQMSRIANEIQKTVLSLRMVPIRSTFQKMNRLVRDLAARQSKQVDLELYGEDTELDRTLVEQLNDPLVHMIRNAVDHGIEPQSVRLAKGKPGVGTIELRAWHQGGSIIIQVKDDGGGLNKERIVAKAIQQGLIKPEDTLTEEEIFALIFEPGFSTAEKVTDVSGRGVGMDVVRRNIEKLRGKIDITSTLGQGSCFKIYLPLTLAIIDGMLISVGQQRYILPALLVRESFRPTAGMISTVQGRGEMVNVRGRLTPLLRLYGHFGITPETTDPLQSVVVVVGYEHQQRCLLVDRLLGKQEVVIKALGEAFKQRKDFAGAAILGDGQVGLILEVDYLLNLKN